MNDVKLNVSQSRGYEGVEVKTISSREVTEMMGITRHADLIKKIDKINEILLNEKIRLADYWLESTYKDVTGRTLKEYQVTKKGCEMLAHKSTGDKGIIFTHKYMERFEQMERIIQERNQKANLLLMIYEGGQDGISASKRLVEIETHAVSYTHLTLPTKLEV